MDIFLLTVVAAKADCLRQQQVVPDLSFLVFDAWFKMIPLPFYFPFFFFSISFIFLLCKFPKTKKIFKNLIFKTSKTKNSLFLLPCATYWNISSIPLLFLAEVRKCLAPTDRAYSSAVFLSIYLLISMSHLLPAMQSVT